MSIGRLRVASSCGLIPSSYTRDWTPAERFRRIVCELLPRADPVYFEAWLQAELARVRREGGAGRSLHEYVVATGLLTYGHLDMVEVILDNYQRPPRDLRDTARVVGRAALWALLPLPPSLRSPAALGDPAGLSRWFADHRSMLRWEPGVGRFLLDRPG